MSRPLVFVLSWLLSAMSVAAQARTEFDIVGCVTPSGWTIEKKSDQLRCTAPDQSIAFTITPSRPLDTTLAKLAESVLDASKGKPEFREEGERKSGKHIGSGGRFHTVTYSYAEGRDYVYEWVALVAAGDRYVALTTVTRSSDAFNRHAPAVGRCIDSLSLTTSIVVEKGSPNLTRYMLDEVLDFLEWLMQTPLTDDQKATVEAEVRGYWQKGVRTEIDDIGELLAGRKELAGMSADERELARQAVLDAAIKQWREEKDSPSAKLMLAIWDSTHQPIAKGEPPLTRQSVEAFAEFLWFAAGQTVGVTSTVPKETKDKLVTDLAAGYADLAKEQRETIAGMPMLWAALRVAWRDLDEAGKRPYLEAWKQSAPLVELGKQVQATSQQKLLELQARLRAQHTSFTMMSNMMLMQHQTSMSIINNIGGFRYEYRWR